MGLYTCSPKRTSLVTDPPRWLMPCSSLFFTSSPVAKATSAVISEAFRTPCPPNPANTILVTADLLIAPLICLDVFGRQQADAAVDDDRQFGILQRLLDQLLPAVRIGRA